MRSTVISTRSRRVAAFAAAAALGTTMLTGCLGDKKDDAKPAVSTSASAEPSADASDASDEPTGKASSGSSTKPKSSAKPGASSDTVELVPMAAGECFDFNGNDINKKSCSGPHDDEVVKVLTLDDSTSPLSMNWSEYIGDKCEAAIKSVWDRQPNAEELMIDMVMPTSSSWMMDSDRRLVCMLANADKTKMTGALK